MRSTVSLFILYALAVTAVGVPVEFTLGDGAVLSNHTLECSDFGVISDMTSTLTTKEEVELSGKPVQITLSMIENEDMLTQLKRFWCEEVSEDMEDIGPEQSSGFFRALLCTFWCKEVPGDMEDIGPEQFSGFFRASNFLFIRGDTSMRFARNMARAALLGRHLSAIVKKFPYPNPLNGWDITWQMLIALAAQTGSEVRVSITDEEATLCSAGNSGAETYGVPALGLETKPTIKKLTVKCDFLGNTCDTGRLNVSNRMAVIVWFLCHLGVPSLSIGSKFGLTPGDIQCFGQAASYTKDLESRGDIERGMALERLDLSEGQLLIHKAVKALIPNLPSLKELQINVVSLAPSAGHAFKECKKLERLEFGGVYQDSSFIEALVPNLPSLKELRIYVRKLAPSVGNAFEGCKQLERLVIGGYPQDSSFIEALVPNLPSIKELRVKVGSLRPEAGNAFEGCKQLERLVIGGYPQDSSFIEALVPNLPSIKELRVKVGSLRPEAGLAFEGRDKLEKLGFDGYYQGSLIIEALAPNLPSIKELDINVRSLSPEAGSAFKGCKKLEKLIIRGNLIPGFFKHILCHPLTDSLRVLRIYKSQESQDPSDEDDQAIAAAQGRSIQISIEHH